MSYDVKLTPIARAQILEQARYIAVDCDAPLNAEHWLDDVLTSADTLADFPQRCTLAPENKLREYEIRRLLIGDYFLLFTIVENDRTVWVIGLRHGSRLPRRDELPDALP